MYFTRVLLVVRKALFEPVRDSESERVFVHWMNIEHVVIQINRTMS